MMNVPGQKPKDGGTSIDHLFCDPCDADGHRKQASGYCKDCTHYLCQQCYDVHCKPMPLRHHSLLDARAMPKTAPVKGQSPANKSTLFCPQHPDKTIDIYCNTHDTAICYACAFNTHKACDTEVLNDTTLGYDPRAGYKSLEHDLSEIQSTCVSKNKHATSLITNVDQSNKAVMKHFQDFRSNLNDHLDTVEKELLETVQEMKETDVGKIQDRQVEYKAIESEALSQKADLKKYENNSIDLYVMTKKIACTVTRLQQKLQKISLPPAAVTYSFHPEAALEKFLSTKGPIGTIERTGQTKTPSQPQKKTQATHTDQRPLPEKDSKPPISQASIKLASATFTPMSGINVKTKKDTSNCWITGIAILPPDRLLMCDYNNHSIKCVNMTNNTITSCLKLSSKPWDVTLLPENQAAITLHEVAKIQVISTSDNLSPVRIFKVGKYCRGIRCIKDKLVVSFTDTTHRVEIMDYYGKVLQTITTGTKGLQLFDFPFYLEVGQENNMDVIYVSNNSNNTIVKLDMDGRHLFTYSNQDLHMPRGLAVTRAGEVLVCSYSNHQVHLLSSAGEKIKTLLSSSDGLHHPGAMCVAEEEKKLFVSNEDQDEVKVYKIN